MLHVTLGQIIETFEGYKGEVVAVYNNTIVADFSMMQDYSKVFEESRQVVRKTNIRKSISVKP